ALAGAEAPLSRARAYACATKPARVRRRQGPQRLRHPAGSSEHRRAGVVALQRFGRRYPRVLPVARARLPRRRRRQARRRARTDRSRNRARNGLLSPPHRDVERSEMTKHPVTMLDLPGAQAAQRERTFLLRQPIEQWKEPFATAL